MREMAQRMASLALIGTIAIGAVLIANGQGRWAAGFAVAAIWSVLNFWLIIMILETAVLKRSGANLPGILMVKFPALYLAGFWILTSRWFPAISLLAGMTLTLVLIGVVQIWPKRT